MVVSGPPSRTLPALRSMLFVRMECDKLVPRPVGVFMVGRAPRGSRGDIPGATRLKGTPPMVMSGRRKRCWPSSRRQGCREPHRPIAISLCARSPTAARRTGRFRRAATSPESRSLLPGASGPRSTCAARPPPPPTRCALPGWKSSPERIGARMPMVEGWVPVAAFEITWRPCAPFSPCAARARDDRRRQRPIGRRRCTPRTPGARIGSDRVQGVFWRRARTQVAGGILASQLVGDLCKRTGGGDEGRAMAEIIYDEAPGLTRMTFAAPSGAADKVHAIDALVAQGVRVIADDIVDIDSPFFQDGAVSQAVDRAQNHGVAYCALPRGTAPTPELRGAVRVSTRRRRLPRLRSRTGDRHRPDAQKSCSRTARLCSFSSGTSRGGAFLFGGLGA